MGASAALWSLRPQANRCGGACGRTEQRDAAPEIALRRSLHALGLRYRVETWRPSEDCVRRADVCHLARRRWRSLWMAAFGMAARYTGRGRGRTPAGGEKRSRAIAPGTTAPNAKLAAEGWTVVRVWEHEDAAEATGRIVALLRGNESAQKHAGCLSPRDLRVRGRGSTAQASFGAGPEGGLPEAPRRVCRVRLTRNVGPREAVGAPRGRCCS